MHNLNNQDSPIPVGFYRAKECAALLGISKSTFWLWVQQKQVLGILVPSSIKLSPGVTVWKRADIHEFCEKLSTIGRTSTPPEAA